MWNNTSSCNRKTQLLDPAYNRERKFYYKKKQNSIGERLIRVN